MKFKSLLLLSMLLISPNLCGMYEKANEELILELMNTEKIDRTALDEAFGREDEFMGDAKQTNEKESLKLNNFFQEFTEPKKIFLQKLWEKKNT